MKNNDNKSTGNNSNFQDPMMSSRARNRTVMLTPEVTGQVRALLDSHVDEDSIQDASHGRKRVDTGGFISANALDILNKDNRNPTLVHDFNKLSVRENISPFSDKSNLEGLSQNDHSTREHKSLVTKDLNEKNNENISKREDAPTRSFTAVNPSLKHNIKTGTIESKINAHPSTKEEKSKSGTLTSMRDFVPELQRPITSEFQPHHNLTKEHSKFNEDRGILKHDSIKRVNLTSKIIGFFISYDESESGEVFELRVGRWLITSNNLTNKDCIVVEDPSISELHAVVKVLPKGEVHILDQLSENGTGVIKQGSTEEKDASSGIISLVHGDVVRFGRRYFVYCAVPRIQISD